MPPLHGVGPCPVLGQRPPLTQFPQFLALSSAAGRLFVRQAGEPGFEPGFTVLETVRIAVNSLPQGHWRAKS